MTITLKEKRFSGTFPDNQQHKNWRWPNCRFCYNGAGKREQLFKLMATTVLKQQVGKRVLFLL